MASTSKGYSARKTVNGRKRPASSTPINNSINDSIDFTLECPICLEELTQPKVLICGHNICPSVSPACSTKISKKDAKGQTFICPTCKRITTVGKALETNYGLRDTLEKAKQMKNFYESMAAERSRVESGELDSIKCYHCQKTCPTKNVFVCTSATCAEKKRVTLHLYHSKSQEEIDGWEVKKMCGDCACRQHRGHAIEEIDDLAVFNCRISAAGEFISAVQLNDTLPDIVKTTTAQVDFFSMVTSHYENCFKISMEKLRRPENPLLRHEATKIVDQMKKTWLHTKTFFENGPQLNALVEECQKKIFAVQ